jgi:hypothetical protein
MVNKVKALDCTPYMHIMQVLEPQFSIRVSRGAVRKRYSSSESYILDMVAKM